MAKVKKVCFCGSNSWQLLFHYNKPPKGETRFNVGNQAYQRDFLQCQNCGHCLANHNLPLETLYDADYMSKTYGLTMRATYNKIMALPPEKSDNISRVARITLMLGPGAGRRVLDIGSGLCVFLARMKKQGWQATALDPDKRAVAHAQHIVGVKAIAAHWPSNKVKKKFYDLVSFNKVLEHIKDPIPFLKKSTQVLRPKGSVYIEVPDGQAAAAKGPNREEFFIEHWQAFSPLSLLHLIQQAGLRPTWLERLREPSGKYALRALASLE